MNAPAPAPDDDPTAEPRRRRFTGWTLLAPAALVIVVVLMFNAAGSAVKDNDSADTSSKPKKTTPKKPASKLPPGQNLYRVKQGENAEEIATKFGLTTAQLKACNPNALADSYSIQAGQRLRVIHSRSGKTCNKIKTTTSAV